MNRPLVFISHCWDCYDSGGLYRDVIDGVEARFKAQWDVWRDRERKAPGDAFLPETDRVMRECHVALLMLSKDALSRGWILRECHRLMPRLESEPGVFRVVPIVFDGLTGRSLAEHKQFGPTLVNALDLLSARVGALDPLLAEIEKALGDPNHYPASWHEVKWLSAVLQLAPGVIERPLALGWLRASYQEAEQLRDDIGRTVPRVGTHVPDAVALLGMLWVPAESGRRLRDLYGERARGERIVGARLTDNDLATGYAARAWLVREAYQVVVGGPAGLDDRETLLLATVELARALFLRQLARKYGTADESKWLQALANEAEFDRVARLVNRKLDGFDKALTDTSGRLTTPPKPVVLVLGTGHIVQWEGIQKIQQTFPSLLIFLCTDSEANDSERVLEITTGTLHAELLQPALTLEQQEVGLGWHEDLESELTP